MYERDGCLSGLCVTGTRCCAPGADGGQGPLGDQRDGPALGEEVGSALHIHGCAIPGEGGASDPENLRCGIPDGEGNAEAERRPGEEKKAVPRHGGKEVIQRLR